MRQAGIEVDHNSEPSLQMRYKIHNFCNTAVPNLYDLLALFLVWLKSTDEPVDSNTQLGGLPRISTLADRFTRSDGMNQATTTVPSAPQNTTTSQSHSTFLPGETIPPQYLQQLPKEWPYTAYGAARRAHQTTSFPLTNPNSSSETMAYLFHAMLWNPRPLFTPPASARGGAVYQPALQDWVPAFVGADNLSAPASTTGAEAVVSVSISVSVATPADVDEATPSSTAPTETSTTLLTSITTSVLTATLMLPIPTSTSSLVPLPTTLPLPLSSSSSSSSPPVPPSPSPSVTSHALVPVRPPYQQQDLFAKVPDTVDTVQTGTFSTQSARAK
jgi:hypothetical protein